MSRGNPHLNVRVEHTLLAQVADVARRRGVDQSTLVRAIVRQWAATMLDPRRWRVWRP
jgi:hypothetical protein